MEVEHHNLALKRRQAALLTLVVSQGEVDYARSVHLVGRHDALCLLALDDAYVLHALDGDVMEVLATLLVRIECVPTCSHGSKNLDILLRRTGIEYQHRLSACIQSLEQCEVRRGLHRLLEDVVGLHAGLVCLNDTSHAVVDCIGSELRIVCNGVELCLQSHLHERKLLDARALFRSAHFILRRHTWIFCLYADRLSRVNGNVYDLSGNAQAVELGCCRGLVVKVEGAVGR